MTSEEIYAIEPNEDGWRLLPNGNYVKIGNNVRIGYDVKIGNGSKIGDCVVISPCVEIGNRVVISPCVEIGNRVKIGSNFELLTGFASLSLTDRWTVNPYEPGKIRCGCFIEGYDEMLGRTPDEWKMWRYTDEQVELVKAFVTFCRDNEHLMMKRLEGSK